VTEKKSHIFLDSWDLSSVPPRRASAFVTGVSWVFSGRPAKERRLNYSCNERLRVCAKNFPRVSCGARSKPRGNS
jgi:hypothetical protein